MARVSIFYGRAVPSKIIEILARHQLNFRERARGVTIHGDVRDVSRAMGACLAALPRASIRIRVVDPRRKKK